MGKIYKEQIGVNIQLDTRFDLTGFSVAKILYKKPDGEEGFWIASVDGTIISYTTLEDDLSLHGTWYLQAYVEISGAVYFGETSIMNVFNQFK